MSHKIIYFKFLLSFTGEDKLIYSENLWVYEANQAVKIAMGPHGASAHPPMTMVTLFQRTVEEHGNRIAIG